MADEEDFQMDSNPMLFPMDNEESAPPPPPPPDKPSTAPLDDDEDAPPPPPPPTSSGRKRKLSKRRASALSLLKEENTERQWEFEMRRGVWAPYPAEINKKLILAMSAASSKAIRIKLRGSAYTVDLQRMTMKTAMGARVKKVRCIAKRKKEKACLRFKISGEDLINVDLNSDSDPYCIVTQGTKVLYQTEVIQDNLHPSWDAFNVDLAIIDMNREMTFSVYDYEVIGAHELLGRVSLSANKLIRAGRNFVVELSDECGLDLGGLGRMRFHYAEVAKASGLARRGSLFPSPYLTTVVGRAKVGGHIMYDIRVVAPLADTKKPLEWTIRKKFGLIHKFHDSIKGFLDKRKGLVKPFPPRPRVFFSHSEQFLNERQSGLNAYWDSLSKAVPGAHSFEGKEIKTVRSQLYKFLEVDEHMSRFRRRKDEERRLRAVSAADKKLQEQRRELTKLRKKKAQTTREKMGVAEDWKLERLYNSPEIQAIKNVVVFVSMCPASTMIRKHTMSLVNLFRALNIKFETKDVSSDRKSREYMLENSTAANKRLTPQVFKGGKFLAQWPQIQDIHEEGKLVSFLLSAAAATGK